jgi:DNA polymerase gamma 1
MLASDVGIFWPLDDAIEAQPCRGWAGDVEMPQSPRFPNWGLWTNGVARCAALGEGQLLMPAATGPEAVIGCPVKGVCCLSDLALQASIASVIYGD